MNDYLLVLNAGSSSLKFRIYARSRPASWHATAGGQIEGIGTAARLKAKYAAGEEPAVDEPLPKVRDASSALAALGDWLRSRFAGRLLGVGHRVVHGGHRYTEPTLVTQQVLEDLRELVPLAPLHQPHNVAAIEGFFERSPDVPQVACFDTSFHRGQPAIAELVPLPREVRERGVQRYGFHGLSYEYIASALPRAAPEIAGRRVIAAHLGSGASLCALDNGKSQDCTLGFTPLDGLCMGTRPGSLDPGVVLYLLQSLGLSARDVETLLYTRSGLLGISGISSDMRQLLASQEPSARLAIDYFVYRAAKEIGAFAAVLGGLDGLVFTAGIGEHSAEIRGRICRASAWLGIELDEAANDRHGPRISTPTSPVSAWAIPTDEELMIARHTVRLLDLAGGRP